MRSIAETRPILVIGPARSGTTIITSALIAGAGIEGFREGHFLPLMTHLNRTIDNFYNTKKGVRNNPKHMVTHIEPAAVKERLNTTLRAMAEELCPQSVWLDKSPDHVMVEGIPDLRRTWPGARFIFARRRGIENINSRLRKFPHVDFKRHCQIWAKTMRAWIEHRDLVKDCSIEMDQWCIATEPENSARQIAEFLELGERERQQMGHIFANKRPQSTGSDVLEKPLDIHDAGWSDQQIEVFRKTCGNLSTVLGYSETSSYFSEN
jgi:hypothetical protein